MRVFPLALLTLFVTLSALPCVTKAESQVFSVKVTDWRGVGISGVNVTIDNSSFLTDSNGFVTMPMQEGLYDVWAAVGRSGLHTTVYHGNETDPVVMQYAALPAFVDFMLVTPIQRLPIPLFGLILIAVVVIIIYWWAKRSA